MALGGFALLLGGRQERRRELARLAAQVTTPPPCSSRDRDGQKAVSVWQRLVIER